MEFVFTVLGYTYMALIGWLHSKRSFGWSWFGPMTLLFMVATFLFPEARTFDSELSTSENLGLGVIALFFSYPLPGFLALKLDPKIPSKLSRSLRLILKALLYFVIYTLTTLMFALILALRHA